MEKQSLTIKESSISFVLSFVLGQLALIIFAMIGIIICKINGYDSTSFYAFTKNDLGYLISVIVMNFTFLFVFAIFKHNKADKITNKIKISKIFMYLVIAVASYFALYPVIVCFNSLFNIQSTNIEISGIGYVYSIFSRILIPAVCEELLFRGLIFKGLSNKNKQLAIFISALMFSIFHMSSEQLLYPVLMGLLLGVIMAYENNIIYCIIVHLINNSLALSGVGYYFVHWSYYLLAGFLFIGFVSVILYYALKNTQKFKLTKLELFSLLISLGIMIIIWILINVLK